MQQNIFKKKFFPKGLTFPLLLALSLASSSLWGGQHNTKPVREDDPRPARAAPAEEAALEGLTQAQGPTEPTHEAAHALVLKAPSLSVEHNEEKVLRVLIPGRDGRRRIPVPHSWPTSVHALVVIRFPNLPHDTYCSGSGTFIDEDTILTAGHNLYDVRYGGRAVSVRVIPAINDNMKPFGEAEVKDFFYPEEYERGEGEDYGIITLKSPIGRKTGYFGIGLLADSLSALASLRINVTGYPGDKIQYHDHSELTKYQMWHMDGPVKEIDSNLVAYQIDTFRGQSGSGVWCQYQGQYFLVAVHIGGDEGTKKNWATRMTQARYGRIREWTALSRWPEMATWGHHYAEITFGDRSLRDLGLSRLVLNRGASLTKLHLWSNGITGAGARTIALHLPNLTDLNLAHNPLKDEGANHLIRSSLPQLKYLDLWNTHLTGVGLRLDGFFGLETLKLGDNGFTEATKMRIRDHLRGRVRTVEFEGGA